MKISHKYLRVALFSLIASMGNDTSALANSKKEMQELKSVVNELAGRLGELENRLRRSEAENRALRQGHLYERTGLKMPSDQRSSDEYAQDVNLPVPGIVPPQEEMERKYFLVV